jgi:hypothetical protein
MNIFNLRYAKLDYHYDQARVREEILAHSFVDIPASQQFLSARTFDLVDPSLYDQVTVVQGQEILHGTLPSWQGYSFTHIPGDRMSSYGGNRSRLGSEQWQWKPQAQCDYIKQITEDLGFTSVQNVRAMSLKPPGFGPVHNDLPFSSDYYSDHISVTLNIESGGQPLTAMIDGQIREFNDSCFLFRDDCWHGVGQVTSQRIQLRINGQVDRDRITALISKESPC